MDNPDQATNVVRLGLRARQRMLVREELTRCALELFDLHGFDDVSVEDIASRAGVAPRTFFRYFAAKEDVALHLLDDTGPLIRKVLKAASPRLSLAQALRDAFCSVPAERPELAARSKLVTDLALSSPRLRAGLVEHQRQWAVLLAAVIAEREGMDAGREMEPLLWASMAVTIAMTYSEWEIRGEGNAVTLEEAFDRSAAMFGRSVAAAIPALGGA
ncbi:MAG: TetR family transcriptional regulator [Sphingobium sp.]